MYRKLTAGIEFIYFFMKRKSNVLRLKVTASNQRLNVILFKIVRHVDALLQS